MALNLSLKPHPENIKAPKIHIDVKVELSGGPRDAVLRAHFKVSGETEKILYTPDATPERKHDLWKNTCFEIFFGDAAEKKYWEVNGAPSESWNFYRFDSYRSPLKEESEKARVKKLSENEMLIELPVYSFLKSQKDFLVGVSAVIEDIHHEKSYWSIKHAAKPDFHARENWIKYV